MKPIGSKAKVVENDCNGFEIGQVVYFTGMSTEYYHPPIPGMFNFQEKIDGGLDQDLEKHEFEWID